MSYDSVVLADSPTHFWRLNDAAGATSVGDAVGGLTLTALGTSPYGLGAAGIFPADGETVMGTIVSTNYFNSGAASMGTGTRSYEFQLFLQDLTKVFNVLQNGVYASGSEDIGITTGGVLWSNIWQGGAFNTVTLSVQTPYHIVMTYDGSHYQVFVNGVLTSYARAVTTAIAGAYAGVATTNATGINGKLGKVAYYTYLLSQAQVSAHYHAALGISGGKATQHVHVGGSEVGMGGQGGPGEIVHVGAGIGS